MLKYLSFIALFFQLGCETAAKIDNPKIYRSEGIYFEYPSNWTVNSNEYFDDATLVTIESTGDAIVIISVYNQGYDLSLEEFSSYFSEIPDEFEEDNPLLGKISTFSSSTFSNIKTVDSYKILTEKYFITVLGESFPHTRTYRRKIASGRVCFVMSQVPDEDYSKVVKGFELISSSFEYN
tara:strand:+ start:1731 stop:2270 length:540 start_codon:yes stop_codon:yes gene_type:complete